MGTEKTTSPLSMLMVLTEAVLFASISSAGVVEKNLMFDFELTSFSEVCPYTATVINRKVAIDKKIDLFIISDY